MLSSLPLDFTLLEFENASVKLIALKKIMRTEIVGLVIEEVEERHEFTVPFWVALILIESGMAKMSEGTLTNEEWTQIHFKERFNPGGPLAQLPKDFYLRAYISISLAAKTVEGDPAKLEHLNRLNARFREIVESRIGKVTRIAAAETSPQPSSLQMEEDALYHELDIIISEWRIGIRKLVGK